MGDGLKRVAKLCGGLIATDGRSTVEYDADGVPKGRDRGWRPIETAPKDHLMILLFDGRRIHVGRVRYHPDTDGCSMYVDDYNEYVDAKYWMPLPAPPC